MGFKESTRRQKRGRIEKTCCLSEELSTSKDMSLDKLPEISFQSKLKGLLHCLDRARRSTRPRETYGTPNAVSTHCVVWVSHCHSPSFFCLSGYRSVCSSVCCSVPPHLLSSSSNHTPSQGVDLCSPCSGVNKKLRELEVCLHLSEGYVSWRAARIKKKWNSC